MFEILKYFRVSRIPPLWKDPFYTLAFCRPEKYNGFTMRDWGIFLSSLAIGNFIWALSIFGGIEVFKLIF